MKKKVKITFLTGIGTETKAKIIDCWSFSNIGVDIQNNGMNADSVLKIEVIQKPTEVEDLSSE